MAPEGRFEHAEVIRVTDPFVDCDGDITLTPLGEDLYRVEEQPVLFLCGVQRSDVVHLRESHDGTLVFVRRFKKGDWETLKYFVSLEPAESVAMAELAKELEAMGCESERVAGGVFFVYVPPHVDRATIGQRVDAMFDD